MGYFFLSFWCTKLAEMLVIKKSFVSNDTNGTDKIRKTKVDWLKKILKVFGFILYYNDHRSYTDLI